jgi:beta-lactamase regulating signal transducer with metallopeptidase domain
MNETGTLLLWCAIQATLNLLIGAVVYLSVRRFGPSTGAWAAASTLLVLCAATAAAFSPWPHWWSPRTNDKEVALEETEGVEARADTEAGESRVSEAVVRTATPKKATVSLAEYWKMFRAELEAANTSAPSSAAARRWPKIIAVTFIAGTLLALARMAIGFAALARFRRRLLPITDPRLTELAESVARSLGCRRSVELKQSASLTTPATLGWLRPVIVLPGDWQSWTDLERRVVLAHETAHIARGDYLTWLVAQISVALHVYHPLVHWLAGRLRLEQELAADACAAELSGGRENYLYTLAQMALRQDDRSVAWAARPFLPTRGTLLRRVEMLSETKRLESRPLTRRRAVALASVAGIVALVISGIRAPVGDSAHAAPPAKPSVAGVGAAGGSAVAASETIDLSYLPASAVAVFAVRPAELFSKGEMQPLVKLLNETIGLEQKTGLKVENIEEIKVAVTRFPESGEPGQAPPPRLADSMTYVTRYKEPFDWRGKFGENLIGKPVEATIAGKTYYHSDHGEQATRPAFYVPDDRTIVFGPEIDLTRVMLASGRSKPDWASDWEKSAKGPAAAMVDVAALGRTLNQELKRHPQPQVAAFAPLWEKGQRLFVSVQAAEGLAVAARVACANSDDAERVRDTLQAVLTLARNALDEADRAAAKATATQAAAMVPMIDLGREILKQGKLTAEDRDVHYATSLDVDLAETAVSVLTPAVVAARQAAQRAQATNNIKQIMLAFFNYHDVHGHFPAPVVLGPDGKTPHSWRVEILPYLDQQELYKQYRMEEPWDSDNNKKVLAQMPMVYREPQSDPTRLETSYLALVGAATALGPKDGKGTKIQEIRDGTSNTIAIVEAKRAVAWTKPEDIDYDTAKPLPMLGGRHPGGFLAGFCDGSVRFLAANLDQQKIHALITKAGGEPITNP